MQALRCFIAVDVADEVRHSLTRQYHQLKRQAKEYRWVDPENYHLTIKFLGNVAGEKVPDITAAVHRVARDLHPFEVRVEGFDAFPYRSTPRVVWAGISNGSEELVDLWRRVGDNLSVLGFPHDQREYTPHLTLGRAKSGNKRADLMPLFNRLESRDWGAYMVSSVKILKSEFKRKGPVYTVLDEIQLGD